jgi:hypothetical protein
MITACSRSAFVADMSGVDGSKAEANQRCEGRRRTEKAPLPLSVHCELSNWNWTAKLQRTEQKTNRTWQGSVRQRFFLVRKLRCRESLGFGVNADLTNRINVCNDG